MKKNIFCSFLLSCTIFWSVSGCSTVKYEECMISLNEEKLERALQNRQENCFVFFADQKETHYEAINRQSNLYYAKNNYLTFYKLDIQTMTSQSQYLSLLQSIDPTMTTLSNATALFHCGKIYRAHDFSLLDNSKNEEHQFYTYIEGIDSFAVQISYSEEQGKDTLIEISSAEVTQKIENQEDFLLFAGQKGCGGCENCKALLDDYLKSNKRPIYYVQSLLVDGIKIEYTPTFLTFQRGTIKNYHVGCYTVSQFDQIFSLSI